MTTKCCYFGFSTMKNDSFVVMLSCYRLITRWRYLFWCYFELFNIGIFHLEVTLNCFYNVGIIHFGVMLCSYRYKLQVCILRFVVIFCCFMFNVGIIYFGVFVLWHVCIICFGVITVVDNSAKIWHDMRSFKQNTVTSVQTKWKTKIQNLDEYL